jgi:hypothetical protein
MRNTLCFLTILCLACSAFGQQKRVNGVEVVSAQSGTAADLTLTNDYTWTNSTSAAIQLRSMGNTNGQLVIRDSFGDNMGQTFSWQWVSTTNRLYFQRRNTDQDFPLMVTRSGVKIGSGGKVTTNTGDFLVEGDLNVVSNIHGQAFTPAYHRGLWPNGFTNYVVFGMIGASFTLTGTGTVMTNGNIRAQPFWSGAGGIVSNLTVRIATAVGGSNCRFGLYESASTSNLFPTTLIFDSGAQSSAGTGNITVNANNVYLKPNRVYWACASSSAAIAIQTPNSIIPAQGILGWKSLADVGSAPNISIESVTVFGAFPSTFPSTNIIFQNTIAFTVALIAHLQ